MQMIFSRRGDGAPAPKTPIGPDGRPRIPDGVTYFSLEQAVEAFKMSEEELVAIYDDAFADVYVPAKPEPDGTPGAAVRAIDPIRMDAARRLALREVRFSHLTDAEFDAMLATCEARHLDPWRHVAAEVGHDQRGRRQLSVITTIDALLLIAERTGQYEGTEPAEFLDDEGNWTAEPWTRPENPVAARKAVRRKGFGEAQTEVATWRRYCAYVQTPRGLEVSEAWIRGGPEQLAKCALALSIRRTFPEETGSLYVREEMAQAHNPPAHKPAPVEAAAQAYPPPPLSSANAGDADEVEIDDTTPTTLAEFHDALAAVGFASEQARASVIAKLKMSIPYPPTSKSFWAAALRRVRQRPDLYGVLAA